MTAFHRGNWDRAFGDIVQVLTISKLQNWCFLPGSLIPESMLSSPIRSKGSGGSSPSALCEILLRLWLSNSTFSYTLSFQSIWESFLYQIFPFVYLNSLTLSHWKISISQVFILQKYKARENPHSLSRVEPRCRTEKDSDWINSSWMRKVIWQSYICIFKRSKNYWINL